MCVYRQKSFLQKKTTIFYRRTQGKEKNAYNVIPVIKLRAQEQTVINKVVVECDTVSYKQTAAVLYSCVPLPTLVASTFGIVILLVCEKVKPNLFTCDIN